MPAVATARFPARSARLPAAGQPVGGQRQRVPHRHAGAGAAAADAARARRRGRPEHAGLRQRLPRLAAGHGGPGDLEGRERSSPRPASASCRRSTRNWPPRRCWARSGSSPTPSARSMACSRCGTARARASTAPATPSSTATPTAARRTAACWWWRATTTAACRRRCRTRATMLFQAFHMPVVAPANVAEYLEFGLYGWALSRYSGNWVGLTALSEVVESGATVDLDAVRPARRRLASTPTRCARPPATAVPADGLHYRWPDLPSLRIESRLHDKLAAVRAFARVNSIDREVIVSPQATRGHRHLRQGALRPDGGAAPAGDHAGDAGRGRRAALQGGPVVPARDRRACRPSRGACSEILVVEEKAPVVEAQTARPVLQRAGARAAADRRQARCAGRAAGVGARRTAAVAPDRDRRALDRAPLPRRPHARRPPAARARLHAAGAAVQRRRRGQARAVLLRRLPAQHQHQGARRLARAGRHRLPLHGGVDGPRDRRA